MYTLASLEEAPGEDVDNKDSKTLYFNVMEQQYLQVGTKCKESMKVGMEWALPKHIPNRFCHSLYILTCSRFVNP